jgi:hypothetical protein
MFYWDLQKGYISIKAEYDNKTLNDLQQWNIQHKQEKLQTGGRIYQLIKNIYVNLIIAIFLFFTFFLKFLQESKLAR